MGVRRRTGEQWLAMVAAFERSSQSVERFCKKHDIRPATFRWWRWRLREVSANRESTAPTNEDIRLLPVSVVGLATQGDRGVPIEIAFADVSIRIEAGTDVAYVAALVTELRSRC